MRILIEIKHTGNFGFSEAYFSYFTESCKCVELELSMRFIQSYSFFIPNTENLRPHQLLSSSSYFAIKYTVEIYLKVHSYPVGKTKVESPGASCKGAADWEMRPGLLSPSSHSLINLLLIGNAIFNYHHSPFNVVKANSVRHWGAIMLQQL